MQDFYNYSQKDTNFWSIKNSILTYLPKHNELKKGHDLLKSNNSIRGLYKDKIIKEIVYVSSCGFKKDYFFRKHHVEKSLIQSKNSNFVTFFDSLNYRLLYIHFHPIRYYKKFLQTYFKKKFLLSKKKLKVEKRGLRTLYSTFWTNYIFWKNFRLKKSIFNYNKILLVKKTYKNFFCINEFGLIKIFKKEFFAKLIFTGLIRILPWKIKSIFKKILLLFNLVVIYYDKAFKLNNKKLLGTVLLYSYLYKYYVVKFYKFLAKKKLKLRKSNRFLYRYTKFVNKKYLCVINLISNKFLWFLKRENTIETINTVLYNNEYELSVHQRLQLLKINVVTLCIPLKIKLFSELLYISQYYALNLTAPTINNLLTKYLALKQNFIFKNIKSIFKLNIENIQIFSIKFSYYDYYLNFLKFKSESEKNSRYIYNNIIRTKKTRKIGLSKKLKIKFLTRVRVLLPIIYNKILYNKDIHFTRVYIEAKRAERFKDSWNKRLRIKTAKKKLINNKQLSKKNLLKFYKKYLYFLQHKIVLENRINWYKFFNYKLFPYIKKEKNSKHLNLSIKSLYNIWKAKQNKIKFLKYYGNLHKLKELNKDKKYIKWLKTDLEKLEYIKDDYLDKIKEIDDKKKPWIFIRNNKKKKKKKLKEKQVRFQRLRQYPLTEFELKKEPSIIKKRKNKLWFIVKVLAKILSIKEKLEKKRLEKEKLEKKKKGKNKQRYHFFQKKTIVRKECLEGEKISNSTNNKQFNKYKQSNNKKQWSSNKQYSNNKQKLNNTLQRYNRQPKKQSKNK